MLVPLLSATLKGRLLKLLRNDGHFLFIKVAMHMELIKSLTAKISAAAIERASNLLFAHALIDEVKFFIIRIYLNVGQFLYILIKLNCP